MSLESVLAAQIERVYYGKLLMGKVCPNDTEIEHETFDCPVKLLVLA